MASPMTSWHAKTLVSSAVNHKKPSQNNVTAKLVYVLKTAVILIILDLRLLKVYVNLDASKTACVVGAPTITRDDAMRTAVRGHLI